MEEQTKQNKRGWKAFWLVVGFVLVVLYLALVVVLVYFQNGRTHYQDGLNGTFTGIARHFYSIPLWLIMAIVFSGLGTYLYFSEMSIGVKIGSVALMFVLNPFFVIIPFFFDTPHYVNFTEGYKDWAKSVLDIDEIRDWISEHDEKTNRIGSKDFQGPKCLADNYSRFNAGLFFNEEGEKVLKIMSGGGFLDWGIVIGPKDMEVPESEFVDFGENHGEYHLKLAEGAYVYYEFQ